MDVLKIIFSFLIILFPLGELARIQIGNGIAFTLNDILVGCTICTWAILKIRKRNTLTVIPFKPFLLFILVGFISLVIHSRFLYITQFIVSLLYLIRWILYTCLLFVTAEFLEPFKKRIPKLLLISGTVFVIIGYLQYIFYQDLHNLFFLGWDEHMYRLFSSLLDPNFTGAFLMFFTIFLYGMIIISIQTKNKKNTILLLLLTIVTILALLLTYSRSAYLSFLVSSIVFFVLIGKKKIIPGLIAAMLIFIIIISRNFNIENINLFRVVSTEARIETAQNAIQIIQKNPLIGVGFNSYKYAQIRYGFRDQRNAITSHADAGSDNSYLFVFATTGILGFMCYSFIWLKIAKSLLKNKNAGNFQRIFSIIALASMSGIFLNAMFINSLFYPFTMEWIWIMLGLALSKRTKVRESR